MTMPQRHVWRPQLKQKLLGRMGFRLLSDVAPWCAGNSLGAVRAAGGLPPTTIRFGVGP
jgi:hypothetical protein